MTTPYVVLLCSEDACKREEVSAEGRRYKGVHRSSTQVHPWSVSSLQWHWAVTAYSAWVAADVAVSIV